MSDHTAKWLATRDALLARDGDCCHYCGRHLLSEEAARAQARAERSRWGNDHAAWAYRVREINRQILAIDHRVPRAAGGKDTLDNYLLACAYCNGVKSAKPYDVAVLLIRARVAKQGARWGHFAQASTPRPEYLDVRS